ncbi:MAG: DUF4382 domain-containing protein [Phycisphaerae bacterium]
MKRRLVTVLLAVAGVSVALSISSCVSMRSFDDAGSFGFSEETGSLRLLVTDKPYPYEYIEEALVTITRVEIRRANADDEADANDEGDEDEGDVDESDGDEGDGGEEDDDEGDDDEGDGPGDSAPDDTDNSDADGDDSDEPLEQAEPAQAAKDDAAGGAAAEDQGADENDDGDDDGGEGRPFIVIYADEAGREFDLLELQNGRVDVLADADVPAGTYDQMRIVVTEGQIRLNDGREFTLPLRVPSGEQTGIKLHFRFEVEAEQETTLLLDIDLSKAFSPIPGGRIDDPDQIRSFQFSPSIAMRLIRMADAGSVSGTVSDVEGDPLADVSVTTYRGDDEVGNTVTAADGSYVLSALPGGEYDLVFAANGFEDGELEGVSVRAGRKTDGAGFVMQASEGDGDGGEGEPDESEVPDGE